MRVGFIHGVMNTDNMSISGETIDYGPCAFMDSYDPKTVFSSIDKMGRYAYCNQPVITKWNLARFAESLIPLIDENQDLFGACTTSGAAWKLHGRVGDSPIIGAGLFLDNDVGAAAATGLGEAVIRTAGSAMVVEVMRQGATPLEACKEIVNRISKIHENRPEWEYLQVGFIALNKNGEHAGYSLKKGFNYALHDSVEQKMIDAKYEIK